MAASSPSDRAGGEGPWMMASWARCGSLSPARGSVSNVVSLGSTRCDMGSEGSPTKTQQAGSVSRSPRCQTATPRTASPRAATQEPAAVPRGRSGGRLIKCHPRSSSANASLHEEALFHAWLARRLTPPAAVQSARAHSPSRLLRRRVCSRGATVGSDRGPSLPTTPLHCPAPRCRARRPEASSSR